MINRQRHINSISSSLERLARLVEINNQLDLFDLNKHAEPFYRELLNLIYGWHLKNLNTSGNRNQPAIDLADPDLGIAVQVTASGRRDKVQDTLDKFHAHKLHKAYKCLKILVITSKSEFKKEFESHGVEFDKQHDILDVVDLLNEVIQLPDVDRIKEIDLFLERELAHPPASVCQIDSGKRKEEIPPAKRIEDPTESLLKHMGEKDRLERYLSAEGTEDAHNEIRSLVQQVANKISELKEKAPHLNLSVGGNQYYLVARRSGAGACSIEIQWQQAYRNIFDHAQLMVSLWEGLRLMPGRSEVIVPNPLAGRAHQRSFSAWSLICREPKQWRWVGSDRTTTLSSKGLADKVYEDFLNLIKVQ